jgi:hypothetical protein
MLTCSLIWSDLTNLEGSHCIPGERACKFTSIGSKIALPGCSFAGAVRGFAGAACSFAYPGSNIACTGSNIACTGSNFVELVVRIASDASDFAERTSEIAELLCNFVDRVINLTHHPSDFADLLSDFARLLSDFANLAIDFARRASDFARTGCAPAPLRRKQRATSNQLTLNVRRPACPACDSGACRGGRSCARRDTGTRRGTCSPTR